MHLTNGILFNHEGQRWAPPSHPQDHPPFLLPRRPRAVARISAGLQEKLVLGNIDSAIGAMRDYVRGMWMMMQVPPKTRFAAHPRAYAHGPGEFVEKAFARGHQPRLGGRGVNEKGKDASTGKVLVEISERYFRPTEVDLLIGDPSKAKKHFGWEPEIKFE
ncbi:unnamed protein product, partial [Heterosigma akashiwo]